MGEVGIIFNILGTDVTQEELITHFHPVSLDPGEPVPDEVRESIEAVKACMVLEELNREQYTESNDQHTAEEVQEAQKWLKHRMVLPNSLKLTENPTSSTYE